MYIRVLVLYYIMRKHLIVANWKANPDSPGRAVLLAEKIERGVYKYRNVEVVIAPSFPFLAPVAKVIKKTKLGAQNVFWGDLGPYTGEVSWHQLKHFGVQYVIVGHSERKLHLGETDDLINKKVRALLEHGMKPILCVGERERGGTEIPPVVGDQLKRALRGAKKNHLKNLTIAYEPVWAISTMPGAKPDMPDNAFRVMVFIRKIIAGLYGSKVAGGVRIIYGGSVNGKNIVPFLSEGKMQGALVGGASLRPGEFINITRQADKMR